MSTRFSKGQKWSFSLGNGLTWFINSAFNLWVFTFYFAAVKLDVNLIRGAFIIWTIWNAINDPLIGYLSDRTHSRWGRRRIYIMIGVIPVLVLEILIWLPPFSGEMAQFFYLLIMLLLYDTAYTLIALPTDSLFPELYTTVEERTQVNTIRQILAAIGLILAALVPGIFIGDQSTRDGYLMNGIVTAIIVGVGMVIYIKWGAVEREEFKLDYQQGFSYFQSLKHTFKNKGFVLYIIMFFLYEYILLLLATIVPLFSAEVLGTTSAFETSILMGLLYIVGIVSMFLWKKLDVKLGGKVGYGLSIIAYVIATIPMLFISSYIPAIIVVILMGIGFGGMLYFIWYIVADCIDDDELKTGVRREGSFFGIANFFMRLSMVLSITTISLVFTETGWEEYVPNPGVDVIFGLRFLFVIVPAIALGISLVCLYFYPFSKKKVLEMKEKLAELHKDKMEKVRG
ncbi:MAG TPA: MFS transporter [Candidatus Nanopelagicaceae bacterium]|nr:MFS transporter [Candidatus Nanopelagicaceae bacterium]